MQNIPQKSCLFYDLETTDKDPYGQIINLCYILTDSDFNVINDFSREIKIGRLQLPRAGAILANKTDVIEHQKNTKSGEREVLYELWAFINDIISQSKQVTIIGFNNLGFDQNFLRTSFIRNGLNPYYQKNVREADLFLLTQYLSITNKDFPRIKSEKKRKNQKENGKEKISLSLESVTKALGLLEGSQSHNSKDDVLLTIELAKTYRSKFNINVVDFNPYQAGEIHKVPHKNKGKIIYRLDTQYDLSIQEIFTKSPFMFLDSNYRYSLWVDLDAFEKKRKSLRMAKIDSGALFSDGILISDEHWDSVANNALEKFSKVDLSNYFTETECDIEQHIYRVDFSNIKALNQLIWHAGETELTIPDAKRILGRFRLTNYEVNGKQDDVFAKRLKDYALYRYGGQMRIDRGQDYEDKLNESFPKKSFHPTFNALVNEINSLYETSTDSDKKLLGSLKRFYFESEIYSLAGKDLEQIIESGKEETPAIQVSK